MFSALGLVWLSPSTKPHQDQDNRSVHQPDVSCSLPWTRIYSRSLERVNLTKLLGIHFSEHLSWEDCMSTNSQKSCHSTVRLAFYGKLKTLQEILTSQYPRETQVKPCPVRNWMGNEYRLEGPYLFFLSFFLISVLSKLKRTLEKHKQTRLRSETYRQLLFYLDFRSLVSWSY